MDPSLHHRSHDDRLATFTLTNVVPQKAGSNDGPWQILEQRVNNTLAAYCLGDAYIVTGVIPYQSEEPWLNNHRVAVPEYMWSAYCCPKFNSSLPERLKDFFPTYAAIGRNDSNSTEEIVPVDPAAKKQFRGYDVRSIPLETLELVLKERFSAVRCLLDEAILQKQGVWLTRHTCSHSFHQPLHKSLVSTPQTLPDDLVSFDLPLDLLLAGVVFSVLCLSRSWCSVSVSSRGEFQLPASTAFLCRIDQ
ncbi:unnamed protein product [Pleuronectes platessa]|uniref:DNA/RNA non-specific endonuclease/pyrophosphatase/phosphodiesterase domain-containing protein n=1 Tax=Pleuronectes platessa TaxID=8262 RepID=A0A9N7ZB53_PLEPL|nr:unnamed protein product [Pleuronectes platessa]